MRQWRRFDARSADLYENQADPDWDELNKKTIRSGVRFGELCRELAEWLGSSAYEVDVRSMLVACVRKTNDQGTN